MPTRAPTKKKTAKKRPKRAGADVHAVRRTRLANALRERDLDALIVTNPRDIRYLAPFPGDDSAAVFTPKKMHLVTDFRFEEDAAHLPPAVNVIMRKADMTKALTSLIADLKLERVGVQADHLRVSSRRALARQVGARRLKDVDGLIALQRVVKDEAEVGLIRKAVKIQEQAFERVLEELAPGMTELDVAARLEYEMRRRGSEEPAFHVIVAAGANGSKPHAVPGRTKTAKGKPVLFDWGATVGGYRSDMTRTLSLGSWPKRLREVYGVVLEAKEAGVAAVRAGVRASDVDAAARSVIEEAGYGERFGHGLGHGIGLDIHEAPRVAKTSDAVLEEGMVVTIEPGVYLPGVGGVRIEDDILVTAKGGRNLCSLPTDIEWATR